MANGYLGYEDGTELWVVYKVLEHLHSLALNSLTINEGPVK